MSFVCVTVPPAISFGSLDAFMPTSPETAVPCMCTQLVFFGVTPIRPREHFNQIWPGNF